MKEYFLLQIKLLARKIKALGINPVVGFLLFFFTLLGVAIYLLENVKHTEYILIALFSIVFLLPLSDFKRNDFLKFHFTYRYLKVRLLENVIIAMPIIVLLIIKSFYVPALISLVLAASLIFIKSGNNFNIVIPTPFSKTPFEFSVGFRKGFFTIVTAYLLVLAGVFVPNFNIGVFSMILLFIVSLTCYVEPENEYFVWSFIYTSKQFLLMKIKTAIIHLTLLVAPVILLLSVFFFENVYLLISFLLIGYFILSTVIVAKYSSYPQKLSIKQGIYLVLSIQLPPLLLVAFPYFYFQSIKRLNSFLK